MQLPPVREAYFGVRMPYRLYELVVADDGMGSAVTIEVALPDVLGGSDPAKVRQEAEARGDLRENHGWGMPVPSRGNDVRWLLFALLLEEARAQKPYPPDWIHPTMTDKGVRIPRLDQFVDYVVQEPIVPFEESPLEGRSLIDRGFWLALTDLDVDAVVETIIARESEARVGGPDSTSIPSSDNAHY